MYVGAALALAGAALFYTSIALPACAAAFLFVAHVFVLTWEEPNLRRRFGEEYVDYRSRVRRWLPGATTGSTDGRRR